MNRIVKTNQKPILNGRLTAKERTFDIVTSANGVALTEKLRDAANLKIGRVRQYAPRAVRARVHFDRDHMRGSTSQFRVTVNYEVPGKNIVAEHRAHEPMAALDLVAEKIERRLRKRKTAALASRVARRQKVRRLADVSELASVHS